MAEMAVKPVKGQRVAGTSVPTPEVPKTMREAQIKKFPPSSLQVIGQDYSILTATAPKEWSFDDVIQPSAWVHVAHRVAKSAYMRDSVGSLIHVRSADHRWFAMLYIQNVLYDHMKSPCGLEVTCVGPSVDVKTGKACPIDICSGTPWRDPQPAMDD